MILHAKQTGWHEKRLYRHLPVARSVGAETTRSCCEDSCIDGPCRERGMWLGDTAAVTLHHHHALQL